MYRDGMEWDGIRSNGMKWDGIGSNGMKWDGVDKNEYEMTLGVMGLSVINVCVEGSLAVSQRY